MRTGKSVEEWVDQRVTIGSLREGGVVGQFGCTLDGVDESGLVVSYEQDTQEDYSLLPLAHGLVRAPGREWG